MSTSSTMLEQLHIDWHDCTLCPLGATVRHHVLYEIYTPTGVPSQRSSFGGCDVMFVGEGPGVAEDVLGRPFVGPSGQLLRGAIVAAIEPTTPTTIVLANLLACRPWADAPTKQTNRAPAEEEIEACQPRLISLIQIFRPTTLVALGRIPDEYLWQAAKLSGERSLQWRLKHPAYIVRQGPLSLQEYIEQLKLVFEQTRQHRLTHTDTYRM